MTDIEKLVEDCARIFCCGNTCASLHDSRPCCAADHHVRTCAVIRHTLEFAAREGVPNQSKGSDANAGAARDANKPIPATSPGVTAAAIEAATRIRNLSAQLSEARRERDRLQDVIERDRTKAAEIIGEIRGAVEPYRWLGEGRGSYAWDDDRYQMEFSNCMAALYAALDPLRCLASDWSDCPKNFQGARIDWKARATAAETRSAELARALEEAKEALMPFATVGEKATKYRAGKPDDGGFCSTLIDGKYDMTWGDLRRACAALAGGDDA